MRSLYFDGQRAAVCQREAPERPDGFALVRVVTAGVCNTDLEISRGYMGFRGILGHEFVGEVVEGPAPWGGQRVVGEINFACGSCPSCQAGLGRHCPTRRVMGILGADGAFAEYVAVPVANLHVVPDRVSDDDAVFSEPLAAAFEILEQLRIEPGRRCVVLGDGKLGLLVAQVLQAAGGDVLAVGRHRPKLDLLKRREIATALTDEWQPEAAAADIVVEATGSTEGFAKAIAAVRPRGTVVLKSTLAAAQALDWTPIVIHEINVLGSRCGPLAPALDALARGTVDVSGLVSERIPLARADEALDRAAAPGVLKVLIDCG